MRALTVLWSFRLLFVASLLVAAAEAFARERVEECVCRYCAAYREAAEEGAKAPAVRKYAPDRLVDIQHIKIDVTPNFKERTLRGVTTLTFAPISRPVKELTLNAISLAVSEVESSSPLEDYSSNDETLTLVFQEPLSVGEEVKVVVTYQAEPKQGLYFRTAELGYPAEDTHLWTQGETHEAPHWFPCFDYPNERSSTEVICHVPSDMTVLSNGALQSESIDSKTGLKAVHWLQEKPHVNYLVCLVAGHLEKLETSHRDVPLRFFTQPTLKQYAANSFADTKAIMAFFEDEIGVLYPWKKYDQVTIRDFTSGGMENTTLTTLTHHTLFDDASENLRTSRHLDAHEMAHQWFGDYVTCEDWSQLWLNEGFATFYTHLYEQHKNGTDAMNYRLYKDAKGRILNQKNTKPIVYREYKNPWEQFDYRAYPKGSWVLNMLRHKLGKDLYRQAIKNYLKEHALTSVVTADLIEALEDVSGQSLDQFFDQWVFHGGQPELEINYKWLAKEKLARVTIKQNQETGDDVLLFHHATKLRFHCEGELVEHPIEISGKEHEFYIALPSEPTAVRFDPDYTLLMKLKFKKSQALLEAQLKLQDDMMGRLYAAIDLGEKESKRSVAALKEALQNDAFHGVRIAAAESLDDIHTDEAYEALVDSLNQPDARVRLQVVESLGGFYRDTTVGHLIQVVENEKNPEIVAEAVEALGKFTEPQATAAVRTAVDRKSFRNEIALAAIETLTDLGDESQREPLFQLLKDRQGDFTARGFSGALPGVAELWRDAKQTEKKPMREWLETLLQHPSRRIKGGAIDALGELGDPRSLPMLQSFADAKTSRIADRAEKAIKKIEERPTTASDELKRLRKQVRELEQQQEKLQESVEELQGKSDAKA